MPPPTSSNPNNNSQKPEQKQVGPKQASQDNNLNLETILVAAEKEYSEWSTLNDKLFNSALDVWAKSNNEKDKEKATQGIFNYFQNAKREAEAIKNKIPHQNQGKGQSKSPRAVSFLRTIQDRISDLNTTQGQMKARETDLMQAKIDALPESILNRNILELKKIDSEIGKAINEVIKVYSKIEARRKTGIKLSDSERISFDQELLDAKNNVDNLESIFAEFEKEFTEIKKDKISPDSPELESFSLKVKTKLKKKNSNLTAGTKDNSFDFYYDKAKEQLEKSVDESPEKYKKIEAELDKNILEVAKINSEIVREIESKGKLTEESKIRLRFDLSQINNNLIQTADDVNDVWKNIENKEDEKRLNKLSKISKKQMYTMNAMVDAELKLDDKKEMTAKEQRVNAKGISDRIRIIDKQVSEDVDKLSVGKKLTADQKEGHKVLLDVEIVNLKEARDELNALEDIEENQPTRNLVESILIRAENRIQELTDKLEKVRVATEKEVMEKLDAAEKEIEKIEESVRDINRKDAEGKNQLKDNIDKNGGIINKWWVFRKGYKSGQTYHNQRNVSDNLSDPKIYIKEAKDWIADMPESNDKEIKTKTKLLKKARRMNRRITSAKWRHYLTLRAYEKGTYLGDKLGTAIVGKVGDGLDRIFG